MKKLVIASLLSFQVQSKLPEVDSILVLPAVDIQAELQKDALEKSSSMIKPLRYAVESDFNTISVKAGLSKDGQWDQLNSDTWVWRMMVTAENAKTLDFGLHDVFLPPTAELRFYDWQGNLAKGPFTDQKRLSQKQLWPGPILGDIATVELKVSSKYKDAVNFSIKDITRGYRNIWPQLAQMPQSKKTVFWQDDGVSLKSGSCNVDVNCPEGDQWRNQINSVARYTRSGAFLCTGQMLNNTAQDGKPLFLTADHCGFNSGNASSINLWWNYQSEECRAPGSSASGTPISTAGFNDTQSGASLRANYSVSDFALLELSQSPPASYNVFFSGWDARDMTHSSAVGIHHPSGDAKRISFENQSLSITGYAVASSGNRSHLMVSDWDSGTTEGGSSGSAIWNADKLVIGQLHGGAAACGNDSPDWYGRLFTSWEGGGSSSNRLKDWLDPLGTNVETLQGLGDGSGTCSNISGQITHSSSSEETGVIQTLMASASGGTAPYSYSWDVDEDGKPDGVGSSIEAVYQQEFLGNVNVAITDSEGCLGTATTALVIRAPEVNLLTAGNPVQVSGNNDSQIDPGETWRVPVTVQNNGFTTAVNSHLAFEKKAGTSSVLADSFGNSISECDENYIDITSSGTDLELLDNSGFGAEDDGYARVPLNSAFNFYGESVDELVLSTNGYISTDPNAFGADWSNDCPIPNFPDIDSSASRIIPMHGDLIVNGLQHQNFSDCPRTSELGAGLECDVFNFDVGQIYINFPEFQQVDFDFQAILYPAVNQWVYQYNGNDLDGTLTSTGIQSSGGSDGVNYACNTANSIDSSKALCVYHRDNQPAGLGDTSHFSLETPALESGNLSVSQQFSGDVIFTVESDASCGSPIVIDLQAAVYESGFNHESANILNTNVAQNCKVFQAQDSAKGGPIIHSGNSGLWYNPLRSGNGYDMYFIEGNPLYVHYTADENRAPIWYITTQGERQLNQLSFTLSKVSYAGGFGNSLSTVEDVGSTLVSLTSSSTAVMTRTVNGRFSAELIQQFIYGSSNTPEQRTGLWFNQSESGWGFSIGTQGDNEVVVSYIYDNNGQPYWLLGSGANEAVANISLSYINTFCPHCTKTTLNGTVGGTVRIDYNNANNEGTVENMSVTIDQPEHPSTWNRSNMPIKILTPQINN